MKTIEDLMSLKAKKITSIETQLGYLQVLEYVLQDYSFLHVVQWHWNNTPKDETIPEQYNETFYREKDKALDFAEKIGKNLLSQTTLSQTTI